MSDLRPFFYSRLCLQYKRLAEFGNMKTIAFTNMKCVRGEITNTKFVVCKVGLNSIFLCDNVMSKHNSRQ